MSKVFDSIDNESIESDFESENAKKTGSKRVRIILLAMVALVLIAAAVVVLYMLSNANTSLSNGSKGSSSALTATDSDYPASTDKDVPADQVQPTVLPEDIDPLSWVENYSSALLSKDYEAAHAFLPASVRKDILLSQFINRFYVDPAVSTQVYGDTDPEGDTWTVFLEQETVSGRTATYKWSFVKDGSQWIAESRTVEGMPNN